MRLLAEKGYNAETVNQENLQGCSDNILSEVCRNEDRILITLDLDFSDIRAYPPGSNPGITVLRLNEQSIDSVIIAMKKVLLSFSNETPIKKLWLVDATRIRIRE